MSCSLSGREGSRELPRQREQEEEVKSRKWTEAPGLCRLGRSWVMKARVMSYAGFEAEVLPRPQGPVPSLLSCPRCTWNVETPLPNPLLIQGGGKLRCRDQARSPDKSCPSLPPTCSWASSLPTPRGTLLPLKFMVKIYRWQFPALPSQELRGQPCHICFTPWYGLNCIFPNSSIEVLTPIPQNVTLKVFKGVIKFNSSPMSVPNPICLVSS